MPWRGRTRQVDAADVGASSRIATQLFAERGYDAVTTARIAERAQVSVPTERRIRRASQLDQPFMIRYSKGDAPRGRPGVNIS
jgi:hypothetical protein